VIFDDWKEVESFADRHFELYAQTHLGRYSFRVGTFTFSTSFLDDHPRKYLS
jgi:hypothetical protein